MLWLSQEIVDHEIGGGDTTETSYVETEEV